MISLVWATDAANGFDYIDLSSDIHIHLKGDFFGDKWIYERIWASGSSKLCRNQGPRKVEVPGKKGGEKECIEIGEEL